MFKNGDLIVVALESLEQATGLSRKFLSWKPTYFESLCVIGLNLCTGLHSEACGVVGCHNRFCMG